MKIVINGTEVKVGQKWKTRCGDIATVSNVIYGDDYPIKSDNGSYTADGQRYYSNSCSQDLLCLHVEKADQKLTQDQINAKIRTCIRNFDWVKVQNIYEQTDWKIYCDGDFVVPSVGDLVVIATELLESAYGCYTEADEGESGYAVTAGLRAEVFTAGNDVKFLLQFVASESESN